jgi:hypothetical protein
MTTIKDRYGTVLRIWEHPKSRDRYTILPPRWAKFSREGLASGVDPQGMSYHCTAEPGNHLGKRIHWNGLPEAVKNLCRSEWPEYTKEM